MAVIVKTRRLSNPIRRMQSSKRLSAIRKRRNYGTAAGRSWSDTKLTAAQIAKKRASGYKRATTMKANPSRKLSLKQKLNFGTARQRVAARLALKGRRNPGYKKLRKTGQHLTAQYRYRVKSKLGRGGYSRNTGRKKRTKNIGEIVSISLAGLNPGRKRRKNTTMATKRRRGNKGKLNAGLRAYHAARRRANRNPSRRKNTHSRRRNAMAVRRRNPVRRGRRRNPAYIMKRINRGHRRRNPILGITSGTIGKALGVIGGAIGSKFITQLALGGNNTGIMGYGGNLVASIALGWGASKITKDNDFGMMVTVGGIAALVLRVLSDNTSIGQYVNLSLAGIGKGGDTGLGIIQDSSFPVPQVAQPGSMTSFITPRATRNYVAGAVSAAGAQAAQMSAAGSGAKAGMGRMQGRMARRAIM